MLKFIIMLLIYYVKYMLGHGGGRTVSESYGRDSTKLRAKPPSPPGPAGPAESGRRRPAVQVGSRPSLRSSGDRDIGLRRPSSRVAGPGGLPGLYFRHRLTAQQHYESETQPNLNAHRL